MFAGKKLLSFLLCIALVIINFAPVNSLYAVQKSKKETQSTKGEKENKVKVNIDGKTKEIVVKFDHEMAKEMFDEINRYRKQNNLPALAWNYRLSKGAEIRAVEISFKFDHKRPNGKPWYTADEKNMYAENIGKKFKDADGMVESWIGSQSHRDNILNKDMKSAHIVVYNADGVNYAVNSFSVYDKYKK